MDEAAIYLRLSKEDIQKEGENSESINNQRLLLTNFCLEKGFPIKKVYSDDDYSGLYDNRPGFNELMRDAKLGRFRIIVAKSLSRFTRNMEHVEKYIHHDLPLLGIRFIGVVDGIDTNVRGNKKARQIYGLTNEWYCEDLSENIRSVFIEKMKAGEFLGGFAPYGYLKDPDDKHKMIIDSDAAVVVKKIYQLFLEGYGIKSICSILEDMGIDNPSTHKAKRGMNLYTPNSGLFARKYNYWSGTTVQRILQDQTYIGKLVQHKAEKISYKDKKTVAVPKEEWIIVDNHHEPVLDEDVFYKVQKLRQSRRVTYIDQNHPVVHKFAGKLRCSSCGSAMIKSGGVRNDKNDWYLRCQLANKSRKTKCTSHNIRYKIIEDYVRKEIQSLVRPVLDNDAAEVKEALLKAASHEKKKANYAGSLSQTETEIDKISSVIKLLYEDRAAGKISDELFFQIKEDHEGRMRQLISRRRHVREEFNALEKPVDKSGRAEELVKRYCDYSHLTHEMVADFIDYITIGERNPQSNIQEINIYWNF